AGLGIQLVLENGATDGGCGRGLEAIDLGGVAGFDAPGDEGLGITGPPEHAVVIVRDAVGGELGFFAAGFGAKVNILFLDERGPFPARRRGRTGVKPPAAATATARTTTTAGCGTGTAARTCATTTTAGFGIVVGCIAQGGELVAFEDDI